MSRAALYRVYRPQNFDEVEGQLHVATTLRNAAKERHFAQAYLFTGTRGTGKTSMARIVAKAINCVSQLSDGNPCNMCTMCLSATQGRLVDLIEIDAASNSKVDEMRILLEQTQYLPTQGRKKIYIIDEVHMLSASAFNALLKRLEEPPEHIHFILATTEQHKVLPTIISRCQVFHFLPLTHDQITSRLQHVADQEGIAIQNEALESIAHHARGGMRDALSILERLLSSDQEITQAYINDVLGIASEEIFIALYDHIQNKDPVEALKLLQEEQKRGTAPEKFVRGFKGFLRTQLLSKVHKGGMEEDAIKLLRLIDRLESSLSQMKYADIPWLQCELGILEATASAEALVAPSTASLESAKTPTVAKEGKVTPAVRKQQSTAESKQPSPVVQHKTPKSALVSADTPDLNSTFLRLKAAWASFSFKITDPVVRTAIKSTKPLSFEGGVLHLQCQSSVQIAHLGKPEATKLLKEALMTNYALDAEITLQLLEVQKEALETPVVLPKLEESTAESEHPAATKEEEVLKIADLFGGSILD